MGERGNTTYAYAHESTAEHFAEHIHGSDEALFLALVDSTLGEAGQSALDRTASTLGYDCGITYVLMPDADYHSRHPYVAQDAFEHHMFGAYYELTFSPQNLKK